MKSGFLVIVGALAAMFVVAPTGSASASATSAPPPLASAAARPLLPSVPPPPDVQTPLATSYRSATWSGWMDQARKNVHLYYVSATFKVPKISCVAAERMVYFWVGLGGWHTRGAGLEQAGVLGICAAKGGPVDYFDWWDMWPYFPGAVAVHNVSAGDTVEVIARYDRDNHRYYLQVTDLTRRDRRDSFSINMKCHPYRGYTCNTATAEVITEVPGGGAKYGIYMADFHTVNFSGIKVITSSGVKGNLTSTSRWTAAAITMVYRKVMARPSARTDHGSAFSVTYVSGG
jgi:hypothetical protein